ncbi:hypothetical protein K501DRAFT_176779 [Backusella circina FSU 941]|nr:hypothetical protein K501DRAFT_176779 [Backusella circina FSU 941]
MQIEYSENNEELDSIKLLECSNRALKVEMEKTKSVSFDTYKKRRCLSYLYINNKITMLTTGIADKDHWGFISL